jgi:preprotein translocase subunit SecG
MNGLVLTLHIIVSVLLIGGILLQPGTKGGGLGASFGGGGANSAFGAQGATPFLAKATYWLAAGFMATSIIIELLIVNQNKSVLDKAKPAAPATNSAPVVPTPSVPAPAAPAQK